MIKESPAAVQLKPPTERILTPVKVPAGKVNNPIAQVSIDTNKEIKELFWKATSGPDICSVVRKEVKAEWHWDVLFFNPHPNQDVTLELEVTYEAITES